MFILILEHFYDLKRNSVSRLSYIKSHNNSISLKVQKVLNDEFTKFTFLAPSIYLIAILPDLP